MNLTLSKNRLSKLSKFARVRRGSWCQFVPIDKTCGVKFYKHKEVRDKTLKAQQFAYKYNLAPQTGSKITITHHGKLLYGYVTEIVNMRAGRSFTTEFASLMHKIHNIGFRIDDLHTGNVGRRKNGTLVCTDFDPFYSWNNKLKNKMTPPRRNRNRGP